MSWAMIGIHALKAFYIVMFGMNIAVVLTWADRRQGAVIQDRVGPNRAVAWLPKRVAQAACVIPALLVAAGIIGYCYTHPVEGLEKTSRAMLFAQLAVFALWATGLAIAGRVSRRGPKNSFDVFVQSLGDPRRFLWAGLFAHVVVIAVAAVLRGSDIGRFLKQVAYGGAPAVLAVTILGGAFYAAYVIDKLERVGLRLAGLLHPMADGLKMVWKEDFIPPNADRWLHSLAPMISFFPALVVMAVVPFGDTLCFGNKPNGGLDFGALAKAVPAEGVCTSGAIPLQVLDVNVGILYFFALAGTGIIGAALAGWASDNKFSLLGGLRAASQMVSYEVTLGLTIVGCLMVFGTLRLDEMVRWQAQNTWGLFVQPFAFLLFFAASVAESKRIPFDLPEGESEIVAGYFTEYSGMKFAMFFFSEYIAVVSSSALMTTLFFGGWHLPFVNRAGIDLSIGDTLIWQQPLSHVMVVLIGVVAFSLKVIALCWLQLMIRWTLPRFRYDQLMRLGWRSLLPASLINILGTGLVILAVGSASASVLSGLRIAASLTQLLVAIMMIAFVVWFIGFITSPRKKRRILASSAAQFAAALGGTRTARMGA